MSQGKGMRWLTLAVTAFLVAAGPAPAPDSTPTAPTTAPTTAPAVVSNDAPEPPRTDANLTAAPPSATADIPVLMSADAYHRISAPMIAKFDPPPAAKDLYTHGLIVLAIDPATKPKDLNAGDVIVAVDGSAVQTRGEFDNARDTDKEQKLLVCRGLTAAAVPVSIAAGPCNLLLVPHELLGNEYLKSLKAGEKPSDDLRLAAVSARGDLPLAYAALSAVRARHPTGSDIWWTDELTAIALFDDNRYEGALTASTAALKAAPPSQKLTLVRIRVISALTTGRFDLAAKIGRDEPKAAPLVAQSKIEAAIAKAADSSKKRPNPADAKIEFKNRVGDLENTAPDRNNEQKSSQTMIEGWQNNGDIDFNAEGGSYDVCMCGPAAPNVKFTAECNFAATDDKPTKFVRVVRVSVSSEDGFSRQLELYDDGSANVQNAEGKPIAPLYVGRLTGQNRPFKLQMVVVGDRYEFDIDGRRIGYGNMPPTQDRSPRNYTLSIQTVGVTGKFKDAHWMTADAN